MTDIIDAQLHLFEADSPEHPWDPVILNEPRYAGMRGRYGAHSASPAEVVTLLDAHGVHGALVVAASVYGNELSYSRSAYELAPDRFRVVGRLDTSRDDIDDLLASWAADPAFVGFRLNLEHEDAVERFRAGADSRALAAAERHGLTVCVLSPGRFDVFADIARSYPQLPVVIDHLGLFSVAMLDPAVADTFGRIGELLPLAAIDNVFVKMTSVQLLSREPFPFNDAWPHLHAVISAFGVDRLMWGSDATVFEHPYAETIEFLRDTDELGGHEKEMLLGATLRRVWNWPAAESEASA
jgi:L-fuconolactonase